MNRNDLNHRLPAIVQSLVDNVMAEPRMKHLDRVFLPSRDAIIKGIDLLRQLLFPGYFGKLGITSENLAYRMGELTFELTDLLYDQVRCCLRYREGIAGENGESKSSLCAECDSEAAGIVSTFFDRIPPVRNILATDVQASVH